MRFSLCHCFLLLAFANLTSSVKRERCLIVLRDDASEEQMEQVKAKILGLEGISGESMGMGSTSRVIKMVYANITKNTEQMISSMPGVAYTEEDGMVFGSTLSNSIPTDTSTLFSESNELFGTDRYNLDALNSERDQCGNGNYVPLNLGTGVDIYIMDTGINYDHQDLRFGQGDKACTSEPRAKYGGFDAIDYLYGEDRKGADCFGHGTHVAGIAGGLKSGVAKNANLWSIRVLDCFGRGPFSGVILGMDYVMALHVNKSISPVFKGSVVNLSLGGGRHQATNDAVENLVAAGVVVVTASGNEAVDACFSSPGSANATINTGAYGLYENGTKCRFELEPLSNYGDCVDIVAPGRSVLSAFCFPLPPSQFNFYYGINCTTTTEFLRCSGTSMAAPHVSGTVAQIKEFSPSASPQEIKQFLKNRGTDDIVRSTGVNGGSKRLHLF